MEIVKEREGDVVHVRVKGRLDAYWADHLQASLEESVREGAYHLRIHMAEVGYMSSVGIRVLLRFYKEAQRLEGSFAVCDPSQAVEEVIELAGLGTLLQRGPIRVAQTRERVPARRLDRSGITYEVFEGETAALLRCRSIGTPGRLKNFRFGVEDFYQVSFPHGTFGLGLGAFGDTVETCRERFGEFLAVAGAAAHLPTDGANVPDQIVSTGELVPEVNVLYALSVHGGFSHLLRFDAGGEQGALPLSEVVAAGFEAVGSPTVGVVLVAECAGLVGAALRRSPATGRPGDDLFGHPEVRNWISFTPERAYPRSLCVAVGVASREEHPTLAPHLRPLGEDGSMTGHFHGAAFSYVPLQKGAIDPESTISSIFENQKLQCVLHLLTDSRERVGAGESDLVRGACWVGPIVEILTEKDRP